jgi:hypothetical protein
MIQLHDANAKLFLSVSSLVLLLIVTYSGTFVGAGYAASNTQIVAAGDWGCSKNTAETVKLVQSLNPQLVLALGDYSYEKTATCWLDLIKPIEQITKINIGNHEDKRDGLLTYVSQFGLSKPFYSYDIKNIHVITMSTEDKFDTKSEQYSFVVNDLRDAANNPDIKWIIVNLHYPFYVSPNTCKESDCAGNQELRDIYHPLFDKYGVDLVLQGHVHNYQRSYPLNYNPDSSAAPLATSTSKTDYQNPNGVIFAIVGTGGVNLHGLSGSAPFMAYQQDSKFGVIDIHISDNKLDAKFITNDGATLDHFGISKTAKKKIIERISDNIPTNPKTQGISFKEGDKSKPAIEKDLNGKSVITFKDEGAVGASEKTAAKTDELKVQQDKPAIKFKDESVTASADQTKTMTDAKVQQDKPAITFKLDGNAAAATVKTEPKTDELKVPKDKPIDTTAKLGNVQPKDDGSMLVSKGKIEQTDNNNPTISTKFSNDPPTDDKPTSQNGQDKSKSSDQDKLPHNNPSVGSTGNQAGDTEQKDDVEFVDPDTDTGPSINTNENDPFSPLK